MTMQVNYSKFDLDASKQGAYVAKMSRIRDIRIEKGFSQQSLADAVGFSQSKVARLESGTQPIDLRSAEILAKAFGMTVEELLGRKVSSAERVVAAGPAPSRFVPNAQISGPVPDYDVKVPVYGSARGGLEGHFVLNGQQLTDVLAPPTLRGIRNAYAVFVAGDSMEPRYFAGEIVFVNPMIPVRKGDFVVAQISMDDDKEELHAFVKQFKGVTSEKYSFTQFNPAEDLNFERAKVKAVHKIVGSSVQ